MNKSKEQVKSSQVKYLCPPPPHNPPKTTHRPTRIDLPRVDHGAALPDGQGQIGVGAVQGLGAPRVEPDGVGLLQPRGQPVAGLVDRDLCLWVGIRHAWGESSVAVGI
jgi:hypothetical protein